MCKCCGCKTDHHKGRCKEGHGHGYRRQFLTKMERIEKLDKYAEDLRKELEAVEEHVKELKS